MHICLLGDSIFDNAPYVGSGPDIISQLRSKLPAGSQATLLARDGAPASDVQNQLARLPSSATHLVLSVGGNDAILSWDVLVRPVANVAEAILRMRQVQASFSRAYSSAIEALLQSHKPLLVCTIYDCRPGENDSELKVGGLAFFNDVILRAAARHGLPVLDLRTVCTEFEHYANPIEPGVLGGALITSAILAVLGQHDFSMRRAVIYPGPAAV